MRVAGLPSLGSAFDDLNAASLNTQLIPSIQRLLELGVIQTRPRKAMSAARRTTASLTDLTEFDMTRLGNEVVWLTMYRTGVWEAFATGHEGIAEQLDRWRKENPDEA